MLHCKFGDEVSEQTQPITHPTLARPKPSAFTCLRHNLAHPGGIEPLSSVPLLYANGLEDRCGNRVHYLEPDGGIEPPMYSRAPKMQRCLQALMASRLPNRLSGINWCRSGESNPSSACAGCAIQAKSGIEP